MQTICAAPEHTDSPLFASTHGALTFAYNYSPSRSPLDRLKALMGGYLPPGKGLGGLDGAAQAGMIKREVEANRDAYCFIIIARFDHGVGGLKAKLALIQTAKDALSVQVHDRLIDAMIQRYFGRRIWLRDIAERFGASPATVTRRYQEVRTRLEALETSSMNRLDTRLREIGVVGELDP